VWKADRFTAISRAAAHHCLNSHGTVFRGYFWFQLVKNCDDLKKKGSSKVKTKIGAAILAELAWLLAEYARLVAEYFAAVYLQNT